MIELWVAVVVGAAFGAGVWWGDRRAVRAFSVAIASGRSPKARALRAVFRDDSLSTERDR